MISNKAALCNLASDVAGNPMFLSKRFRSVPPAVSTSSVTACHPAKLCVSAPISLFQSSSWAIGWLASKLLAAKRAIGMSACW